MGWKKIPCWIWMSFKVKRCDGFYKRRLSISLFWQWRLSYKWRVSVSLFWQWSLSQEVLFELGVVPSVSDLWSYIVYDNISDMIQTKELRFHLVTKIIHRLARSFRNEWCVETQVICKVHTDLKCSDPLTKTSSTSKTWSAPECHGC